MTQKHLPHKELIKMNPRFIFILLLSLLSLFQFTAFRSEARTPVRGRVVAQAAPASSTVKEESNQSGTKGPDFSMPRTVETESRELIDKALKTHNYESALRSAINLTCAVQSVSSDSVCSVYKFLSEFQEKLPSPYSDIARLVTAQFLTDMYRSNRYFYDRRQLPTSEIAPNPQEWSGEQFKIKILGLCRDAMAERDALAGYPLSDIYSLVENWKDYKSGGYTMLDFAAYRVADILSTLNVGDSDPAAFGAFEGGAFGIMTRLCSEDEIRAKDNPAVREGALLTAYVCRLQQCNDNTESLGLADALLDSYEATPSYAKAAYAVYETVYSRMSEREKQIFYSRLQGHDDLKNLQQRIAMADVEISAPSQVLPGDKISVDWRSVTCDAFSILLVKVPSSYNDASLSWKEGLDANRIVAEGRMVAARSVTVADSVPFTRTGAVTFDGVPAGYYALVVADKESLSSVKARKDHNCFLTLNVSDLSYIQMSDSGDGSIYIVDGRTGLPAKADVTFTEENYNKPKRRESVSTNDEGLAKSPFSSCCVTAQRDSAENRISFRYYGRRNSIGVSGKRYLTGDILTDLAIYHPGDSVHFVAVISSMRDNILESCADEEVKFLLRDSNGETVADISGISDASGRVVGSFLIPEGRMTGRWSIFGELNSAKRGQKAETFGEFGAGFEVSEYKEPTFRVTMSKPDLGAGSDVSLTGNVSTYSGMPLSDVKVNVNLKYRIWMWRWYRPESSPKRSYNFNAQTDASGNFSVTIPDSLLREMKSRPGVFSAVASATSATGETQVSSPLRFAVGEHYTISPSIPARLQLGEGSSQSGDSISLRVEVRDALGNPAVRKVAYEIESVAGKQAMLHGRFESPELRIKSSYLPSGEYKMRFMCESADTVVCNVTVWRLNDRECPSSAAVWSPEQKLYASPGVRSVSVRVGSAWSPAGILMQICRSNDNKIVEARWLKGDGTMRSVEVPAPSAGERIKVKFCALHNLEGDSETVTVYPAEEKEQPEIITETFRDKISPGATESWRFRVSKGGQPLSSTAGIAVMSNAALNAITPFDWSFNPRGRRYYNYCGDMSVSSVQKKSVYVEMSAYTEYRALRVPSAPEWNFYGCNLYLGEGREVYDMLAYSSNARVSTTRSMKMAAKADKEMVMEDAVAESAAAEGESAAEDSAGEIELRSDECPLAFFRPLLAGDGEGELSIDFIVPNFNTTWRLQLICYNPDNMESAYTAMEAVASKPLMVQMNAPRFLRTGDETRIEAEVFNNFGQPLTVSAFVEVYDIATGEVLARSDYQGIRMNASASRTLGVDYTVPSDLSSVGVRVKAWSERGGDGEQSLVDILPASQPVRDAMTFYMDSSSESYELELPKALKTRPGNTVTLEYCDNPEWNVLMQLSGVLRPEGESAVSLIHALYSNLTGASVLRRSPLLAAALRRVVAEGDSAALESPLLKDESLKMSAIEATPWLNSARSETARMRSIVSLTDAGKVMSTSRSLVDRLAALQLSDGGWSWMKGMQSSAFISREVLFGLSMLKGAGNIPAEGFGNIDGMIKRGVAYCDKSMEKEYQRLRERGLEYYPTASDMRYFLTRNAFCIPESRIVKEIHAKLLADVRKEWKNYSISTKCLAADLLHYAGDDVTARSVMESVRQFATVTPEKGMWFDGDDKSLMSLMSPIAVEAGALRSFALIMPGDPAVEQLRQYLLLSRQTTDWHNDLCAANVVIVADAVLSTSPVSESPRGGVRIYLDGTPLDLSDVAGVPGSFTLSLDPAQCAGKRLEIRRKAGTPAWGGVLAQYVAPLKDVQARGMSQLTIEKAEYPVLTDSLRSMVGKASDRFSKGDRVRVTLTLKADRPLDYVMIRDNRGACMEPVEQLTENKFDDGLIYVLEPLNTATNIYISRLTPGVHIISYELTADRDGVYSSGTAEAQSLYYPLINARTGAKVLRISGNQP